MSTVLALEGVHAGYGPFRALFDVSLSVPESSVVALLGPNGSGKTTVARVASGLLTPTAGRVVLRGTDVTGLAPWKIARLGLAHAVEGRSVFASLSVEDNLRLAFRRSLGASGVAAALDRAYAAFPRLGQRRGQEAGTLSGGEQRMLSLARVLADPPTVLVADELSLGLAPVIVDEVYAALAAIRSAGTALLIVEQQVNRAMHVADTVVLLTKGSVSYTGPPAGAGELMLAYTQGPG
jgi:branched-chain amino acid transport system ATP-binding protein